MSTLEPTQHMIEAKLHAAVERHGLVIWLDLDDRYGDVVAGLIARAAAGELSFAIQRYEGSYLALMRALDVGASQIPRLVLHLPGFDEDRVKASPLLELYAVGARFGIDDGPLA